MTSSHAGQQARDTQLLYRGKRVSAIGAMGINGVINVYTCPGSVNEKFFCNFLERCMLPHLLPFKRQMC